MNLHRKFFASILGFLCLVPWENAWAQASGHVSNEFANRTKESSNESKTIN
jgi:UPF0716 family protein affecting phage T7 exclusion